MSDALITALTLQQLREIMQLAAYRVETLTDPVASSEYLRSATSGLRFDVRPGNRLAGTDGGFVDAALVAVRCSERTKIRTRITVVIPRSRWQRQPLSRRQYQPALRIG
jgi:hypothetical protein